MRNSARGLLLGLAIGYSALSAFAQGGRLTGDPSAISGSGRPIGGANVAVCQPLATTAASLASNLATFTMASNPITAGFAPGMTVQVAGFTGGDTYFNAGTLSNGFLSGGLSIISVTSTQIVVSLTHANGSASSNGTLLQFGNSVTPCAGLATIYTDASLAVTQANPFTTDGLGNYGAGAPAGIYYVQIYGSTITTTLRQATAGGGVGAVTGCTATGGVPFENGTNNTLTCGGNLTYSNATGLSVINTTAATSVANQNSLPFNITGQVWNGSASTNDNYQFQDQPATGPSPNTNLVLSHPAGTGSPGLQVDLPTLIVGDPTHALGSAGTLTLVGQSSGSFNMAAANSGGTPNLWVMPSVNPTPGQALMSSTIGNPQSIVWANTSQEVAEANLTGQTAAINTTTLYTTNGNSAILPSAGQYVLYWSAKVTTPGGVSSTLGALTITYVDPDGVTQTITAGAQSHSGAIETTDAGNVTTTVLLGLPILINAGNTAAVTYAFAYASSPSNAMAYNLHLKLEFVP